MVKRMIKALILTIIASFGSIIGFILTYLKISKNNENNIILLSLSISLIIMLYISIFDLIPFGFININQNIIITILLIISGVGIVKLINPNNSKELYQIGIICMITLMLHNIPEGIITFMSNIASNSIGIKIAISILIHNIPEGICIALPIYYSTKNRFKSFIYTFIAGISEPLGGLIFYLIFKNYINYKIIFYLSIIVGGMMIELSINKLFNKCLNYHNDRVLKIGLLLGLVIIILMSILI